MTKKDPQIVSSHRIHKKTTKTKKKMTKKDPQIVSSQGCGRGSIISPLHRWACPRESFHPDLFGDDDDDADDFVKTLLFYLQETDCSVVGWTQHVRYLSKDFKNYSSTSQQNNFLSDKQTRPPDHSAHHCTVMSIVSKFRSRVLHQGKVQKKGRKKLTNVSFAL